MTPIAKSNIDTDKSGFFIGMTCPGCAGELELDQDFFVLNCHHCGSVHRLILPDIPSAFLAPVNTSKREARFSIDRYLKEKDYPLTDKNLQLKRVYYPYWKIDAILLRFRKSMYRDAYYDEETNTEVVVSEKMNKDISLLPYTTTLGAGCHYDGIPDTLGMRTDYIKLMPYSNENINEKFHSYPVARSWEEIRLNLCANLASIGCIDDNEFGVNKTQLFNPKAVMVYFPFYVFETFNDYGFNRYVVDGVTGRMVNHIKELEMDTGVVSTDSPDIDFGSLKVVEHRCSNCGEDLPAEQSYVYICHNCQSLQVLDKTEYLINEIFEVKPEVNQNDNEYFPFWFLKMSEADAVRLKPVFGGIYSSDRMVIPAFKVANLDAMFKLSKRLSSAFPKMSLVSLDQTDNKYHQVNLPLSEAIIQAEVFIYRDKFAKEVSINHETPPFIPIEAGLFYLPFHPENYFFIDSVINVITFEKRVIP
ncbi:hypothetical protein ACFLQG_00530 [Candidatus Zixiibacteriota bacterium]